MNLWLEERRCPSIWSKEGFATIWYIVGLVAIFSMSAFLLSNGYLVLQQNKIKNAANEAVKAAVMQFDKSAISKEGVVDIDDNQAKQVFYQVLEANLKLDDTLKPTVGSMFRNPFELVEFRVYDDRSASFPIQDINDQAKFKHILKSPGVVAILKTSLPDLWGNKNTILYVPAVAEVKLDVSSGGLP